jgi:hypothetical protein
MSLITRRLDPVFRVAGSAALATTALVHAWLFVHAGYRHIPTIGPSFAAMVVAAAVLVLLVILDGRALVGLAAAGFLLSVFGGYVLSATVGLFGFTETGESTAAVISGLAEVGGSIVLALGVYRAAVASADSEGSSSKTPAAAKKGT